MADETEREIRRERELEKLSGKADRMNEKLDRLLDHHVPKFYEMIQEGENARMKDNADMNIRLDRLERNGRGNPGGTATRTDPVDDPDLRTSVMDAIRDKRKRRVFYAVGGTSIVGGGGAYVVLKVAEMILASMSGP